ncbi:MAG: uroporphyrinogen decarboxylase family protein, partial [Planctomycetota bacterium]
RSYREFILPLLKKDVQQAHEAGARLGIITTSAYTPLLDMYREADVDVLIGLDPVQDTRADFARTKQEIGDDVCLWGGVNGFVTVETGTPEQVRQAVRAAIRELAPGGGFILSPVDNVREDAPPVWANVSAFIDEWRACRAYPIAL